MLHSYVCFKGNIVGKDEFEGVMGSQITNVKFIVIL